jgi:hypothetical protein
MNKHQLQARQRELEAQAKKEEERSSSTLYIMPGFSSAYHQRCGMACRRSLVALFQSHPNARLPVNNKWQASSTKDPDLRYLMKKGVLVQIRAGNGRRHPLNRSSSKCQSYLVLADAHRIA